MMRQSKFDHVSGLFQTFNLSPKGTPEGFICANGCTNGCVSGGMDREETFQVNFPPELATEVEKRVIQGEMVEAEVVKFQDAHPNAHQVYELRLLHGGDRPLVIDGPGEVNVLVSGTVVGLNHAKRGEVNGAILDTGDFVHLRPHGAKAVGLKIGQILEAEGDVRPGWAGCRVIEAVRANGIDLDEAGKKHPPSKPQRHDPPHRRPKHKRRSAGHH